MIFLECPARLRRDKGRQRSILRPGGIGLHTSIEIKYRGLIVCNHRQNKTWMCTIHQRGLRLADLLSSAGVAVEAPGDSSLIVDAMLLAFELGA